MQQLWPPELIRSSVQLPTLARFRPLIWLSMVLFGVLCCLPAAALIRSSTWLTVRSLRMMPSTLGLFFAIFSRLARRAPSMTFLVICYLSEGMMTLAESSASLNVMRPGVSAFFFCRIRSSRRVDVKPCSFLESLKLSVACCLSIRSRNLF